MKKLSFLIVALIALSSFATAQAPLTADKIMAEAQATAKKENKGVFVLFHASWCGWCHKMDTAMADPTVSKFFTDSYVIRHMTVLESKTKKELENPGALELMQQYSGEGSGIPFWLVYDKAGKKVADSRELNADGTPGGNVGCPASEKEVAHFIKVLKQTSKIDEASLAVIEKRFRQIETGK